jgi:predicted permease
VPTADRPGELVNIRTNNGSHVSYQAWRQLDESGALAAIAGYQFEQSINWRDDDQSITLVPLLVTANFFDVMRIPMAQGRGFTAAEAQAERDPHVAVVSDGFWRTRLQRDPAVVGRAIVVNGEPYVVTGVLPAGFKSVSGFGLVPEIYLPLSPRVFPSVSRPRSAAAQLVGRLRPDQTLAEGRAALSVVITRIAGTDERPEFRSLTEFAAVGGVSQVREFRELGLFFLMLMIVSGLVLAIACANVAGLLLARSLARRREIALRIALGASRGRLIQQLLIESVVLTTAGAAIGALLTGFAFSALSTISLPLPLPLELHFTLDWRTVMLAVGLVFVSTCLTGLVPALQATRPALVPAIKLDERHVVIRRLTLRGLLVAGQVAVSVLLVVAALLFVRSLGRATSVDPGFDVDRVLVAQLSFVEGRQGSADRQAVEDIIDRARAIPGAAAAAFSQGVPLTIFAGGRTGTEVFLEGHPAPTRVDFDSNQVGPDYFKTMGIRVIRGRDFTSADRAGSAPVILINEEFARRYFPGVDPVGLHVKYSNQGPGDEIIGVVANGKYRFLSEAQDAAIYEPLLGDRTPNRLVHVLVRTNGSPESIAPAVRKVVLDADGSAAVTLTPMRAALSFAILPSRMGSTLLGLLGSLGMVLAMVGLFGVVSFAVSRRTSEIAIRMALGASRAAVLRLVLRDAGRLVLGGVIVGLLLAWLLTKPLSAFLVAGVDPGDPVTFAVAGGTLLMASLAAMWGPAARAMRVAPAKVLKAD